MDTHPRSLVVRQSAELPTHQTALHPSRPPTSMARAHVLNKETLLTTLRGLGVGLAIVRYEGGGDEGNTTETTFTGTSGGALQYTGHIGEVAVQLWDVRHADKGRKRHFVRQRSGLIDALEEFAFEATGNLHGAWWNGHGGQGEVVFNPDADAILVKHEDFHIETTLTETLL